MRKYIKSNLKNLVIPLSIAFVNLILLSLPAFSSLLPQDYLNAVVSIEVEMQKKVEMPDKKISIQTYYQTVGTGFLIGYPLVEKDKDGNVLDYVFLVTNLHVLKGVINSNTKEVWLNFDHKSGFKRYPLSLINERNEAIWLVHPDGEKVDVAVIPIIATKLIADGAEYHWIREDIWAYPDNFKDKGIALGDDVFVLGYPLGYREDVVGAAKKYVVVKSGAIARVDDDIVYNQKSFLIDSSVFPGNSGGPVILKPHTDHITNSKSVDKAYLLGIATGYIPYEQPTYVMFSGEYVHAGTTFENSGLTKVVPMNFVKDVIKAHIKGI